MYVRIAGATGAVRRRRRIDRDDARVVNQLVSDGDDARSLDDAEVGVVDRREHRIRESSAMDDAADAKAVVFVGVARLAARQAAAPLHGNGSGRCHARRKPAVGRIDDERGAPRRRRRIRASAGSARSARRPCPRARPHARDRVRHGSGRLRDASRIPRRSGIVACRTSPDARGAHRIPLRRSTRPVCQGRPMTCARSPSPPASPGRRRLTLRPRGPMPRSPGRPRSSSGWRARSYQRPPSRILNGARVLSATHCAQCATSCADLTAFCAAAALGLATMTT